MSTKNKKDYKLLNKAMNDPAISMKAKGLFAYLFSKSNDWHGHIYEITENCTDGRHSIMSAAKELKALGYISTVTERSGGIIVSRYYRLNRISGRPNTTSPLRQYSR